MEHRVRYVRFRANLWMWARLVPFLAWRTDIVTLLRRVEPPKREPYRGLPAATIAYRAKRSVRRPRVMADRPCLREGVLADRFLRLAGYRPELRFGIDRSSLVKDVLGAHCWVVLDGQTILNEPTSEMIEVLVKASDRSVQIPRRDAHDGR